MKKYQFFKVEGDRITRARKYCPKCGPGVFIAEHKNRFSCGKCGYTEFKGQAKPSKPPKIEEKPAEATQQVKEPSVEESPGASVEKKEEEFEQEEKETFSEEPIKEKEGSEKRKKDEKSTDEEKPQ